MPSRDLILDSLEIRQFRAFHHLVIPRLGRVNLITGKNNVGKTCLLEALRLYARRADGSVIWQMLTARDESGLGPESVEDEADTEGQAIRCLFYGRPDKPEVPPPIRIGPVSGKDTLSVAMEVASWDETSRTLDVPRSLRQREFELVDHPIFVIKTQFGRQDAVVRYLDSYSYRFRRPQSPSSQPKGIPCFYVPANGIDVQEVGQLWDALALTPRERLVLDSVRIIAPSVERITLVAGSSSRRERIPIVKTPAYEGPIPLRSLGEGLNRMFGIALALANARDGLLLIDEVESGLHYSVQTDLWRLIFRVAERLNVQVFATTHSWDCIKGFQEAARETPQDGLLISLRQKKDQPEVIVPVLYSEEDLAIATQQAIAIEVR